MSYYITPGVGMSLANPSTAQAFETTVVNNNFILLENGILADRVRLGFTVCTSGTRPSSPALGAQIIETDTRNTMYWNGSRWVPLDTMPNAASAGLRDALYPSPTAGNQVFRTDFANGGSAQVYNGTVWKSVGAARVAITPASVAGTGVTLVGNRIQFASNSANLNIYGCFTDEFDAYDITLVFDAVTATGLAAVFINDASVLDTTAAYGWVRHFTQPAFTVTVDNSGNTITSMAIIPVAAINGTVKMRLNGPRSARAKILDVDGSYFTSTFAGGLFKESNRYNTSAVNVGGIGFQFSAAASGTIYIEGLR